MFKTGPGPKKNPVVFKRVSGEQKEVLAEAAMPDDVDSVELEKLGFAEPLEPSK